MHEGFGWKTVVCVGLALWMGADPMSAAFSPHEVWGSRCGTCHTVGDGDDVGPDLLGVTERRDRSWLVDFIRSSTAMIEAGDEIALELFEQYGRQKMPDHAYDSAQIEELLDWIAAGGPADPTPEVRAASTATPEERRMGRELFFGERPLSAGGAACAHCHALSDQERFESLGGSLAGAYDRYRDVEMFRLLRGMATPLMAETYGRRPLTDEEVHCIKAFLADPIPAVRASGILRGQRGTSWWLTVLILTTLVVTGDGVRLRRRNETDEDGS